MILLRPLQAVQRGGARSTLLCNTIGKAQRAVLQLDASVAANGRLARRVSLLDQQAQAGLQLRAGAHDAHGAPAGGSVRHAGLADQQRGLQLHTRVHGVHAATEGAGVRHQSLLDQQAGQQLRTGEVGGQAGHASVPDWQADSQPGAGEGSTHGAPAWLQKGSQRIACAAMVQLAPLAVAERQTAWWRAGDVGCRSWSFIHKGEQAIPANTEHIMVSGRKFFAVRSQLAFRIRDSSFQFLMW